MVTACGIVTQGQRTDAGVPVPQGFVVTEDAGGDGAAPPPANVTSVVTNVPANSSGSSNATTGSSGGSGTHASSGALLYPAVNGVGLGALMVIAAMLSGVS